MRWDVHYVAETRSTNADLMARARAGAPDGTVVRAGHQTAGRGRLGRVWADSPDASLLASVLLPFETAPFLTMARVALAVADACRDYAGVETALKWPNDLLVGDRKVAGLLAEADAGGASVVVGVGLNVDGHDLVDGATALSDHCADPPSPAELLEAVLARLDGWLLVPVDRLLGAYRARCATLNGLVRVEMPGRAFEGIATGITTEGELVVAVADAVEVVRAGDVVHVRGHGTEPPHGPADGGPGPGVL